MCLCVCEIHLSFCGHRIYLTTAHDQNPEANILQLVAEPSLDLLVIKTNSEMLFKFSVPQLLKIICLMMLPLLLRISEKYADFQSDRPRFIGQLQEQGSSGRY